MKHPLLNKDSKHYEAQGEPAIKLLEAQATVREQIGWCNGNILKYEYRQDHKGQKESDIKKIATYQAYKNWLCYLLSENQEIGSMIVAHAYQYCNVEVDYVL